LGVESSTLDVQEAFEVVDDESLLFDFSLLLDVVDEDESDAGGALGSEVSVFRGPGAPPVPLP